MLGAGMIGVAGRIQREGEIVHLVAHRFTDLSKELAGIGQRGQPVPLPHGRGDEFHHGSPSHDPREPKLTRVRDIIDPTSPIDEIRVKTRDFR